VALVGNWVVSPGLGAEPVAAGVVSVGTRTINPRELRSAPNPAAGYLGVMTAPGDGGVKISSVTPGSAAAKAGLKADDIVLTLEGIRVEDPDGLMGFMSKTKPGQVLVIKLKRGDEHLELKVTLDKRPANSLDRSDFQNRMGSELSSRRAFATILQHDTVIKPRDCGGPLVDLDGKAVGLNIARAGRVESHALPSELILTLLPELKSGKLSPEKKEEAAKRLAELEKKVSDAKKVLEKALADKTVAEKNIEAAKKALAQAEAEAKAAKAEKK
jgi:serine protease Do